MPVGEDQIAHVEITREVARRVNHLYGREPDFEQKVERALKQLGSRNAALYKSLRKATDVLAAFKADRKGIVQIAKEMRIPFGRSVWGSRASCAAVETASKPM